MPLRSPLSYLFMLVVLLLATAEPLTARKPARASRLRDITVTIDGDHARITLLVDGNVGTLVTETRKGNAQIRARAMAADRAALRSARVRQGVHAIVARIERRDVLVLDVDFATDVTGMLVLRRTADSIVVHVSLDADPSLAGSPAPAGARPRAQRAARRWALSTIVIDAGHGGKDPGAIGIGKVREKDVTMAVARHLRKEILRNMPGVRVVLTRSDDTFVELYRRGQIANERDGRLFVSIHCNALPDSMRAVNGFECYILRPGKSEDAARVAAAENGAIRFESDQAKYEGMSAESAIVATMAQSAFARYSEEAAQAIGAAMRSGTRLADRGVHQAGFFVLVGASMPAVLVEIGYLSSPADVKTLKSSSGQRAIARSIARGIVNYEKTYSASLR